jgi:DNA-binding response OmpR family regulator
MINELRKSHEAAEVPVIFVSAMTRPQDIEAGLNAGAREYITKPFSPQRLLSSVENCIGH